MKGKNNLVETLKSMGPESPSAEFVDFVMDQLSAEEVNANDPVQSIFHQHRNELTPAPSLGFENKLIDKIKKRQKQKTAASIIPKWVIAAMISSWLVIGLVLTLNYSGEEPTKAFMNIEFDLYAFINSSKSNQILVMCTIIGALLLLTDRFLSRRSSPFSRYR